MARAQARAGFGLIAAKAFGAARIDDLRVAQLAGRGHLGHVAHQARLALDGDVAVRA